MDSNDLSSSITCGWIHEPGNSPLISPPMLLRPLGTTGLHVSEIGLGAWQLGSPAWGLGSQEDREAMAVVHQAVEGGCRFFDTAPGYGGGRSESLLGEALKPYRDQVVICTKFGHDAEGGSNFEAMAVEPSLSASLRRLQTDRVEVLLLHNPPFELLTGAGDALFQELERLKTGGLLRAYGVSLDHARELEAMVTHTPCTVAEVLFNVFHQEPQPVFAQAQAQGIGLIAKVPLDSGWLSGKYRRDSSFSGVRDRWSPEIIARRAGLVEQFATLLPPGTSLAHGALQYILAQAEIATVIPGAKNTDQVRSNLDAARNTLPPETIAALRELWERELRPDPLPW
ncbi:MAG: aldo/keto reductase [Candidatus Methylacidiphilales bacterium]|nr:aldo/keto reductase [Candidatus Methylacidiphilales bacterium]